jgi:pyruvate kinase
VHARRTKIVATLGPSTDPPGMLDQLVAAGMDCARINCSHGTHDDHRRRARELRAAAEGAGRPVSLLFDLQGPKLRLASDTVERHLQTGDRVVLCGNGAALPEAGAVRVAYDDFGDLVTDRSELVIGDGVPRLLTESVAGDCVVARALSPGPLLPNKGINVTYARPSLPAITDKDMADLDVAVEMDADFVALSFVRNGIDMIRLVELLQERGSQARTVAKIEKIEAYEHLDEILAASHGIMVARGDYGVEAGFARVPLMQKDTIYRATQAGKLVITATQMFESMISSPEPTRAEAADVANAVIDGTSAVMLSAETSVGAYPVQAVIAMSDIASVAEDSSVIRGGHEPDIGGTAAAVMHAAITLGDDVDAVALVVPTTSGGTARACAKYRRKRPIIALAHDPHVANQLALEWGLQPATIAFVDTVDELIDEALVRARDLAGLEPGGLAVLTAGPRTGTVGATNLIVLREIPPPAP